MPRAGSATRCIGLQKDHLPSAPAPCHVTAYRSCAAGREMPPLRESRYSGGAGLRPGWVVSSNIYITRYNDYCQDDNFISEKTSTQHIHFTHILSFCHVE